LIGDKRAGIATRFRQNEGHPMTYSKILGAIVAGGASSRFGSDKALALLDGQPLIAHAQAALEPFVGALVVCGRTWGGLPMLADVPVAGLGPLGGIAAALGHARAEGFDHVLTIGCDMPGVPDALLDALIAAAPAYCSDAPILGCWPVAAADGLAERLGGHEAGVKDGALSIRRWAESIGATAVPAPGPLRNVNTPADLPA
jgi:molybdopterin-guanine dinucleotide biosynthesis protein A